MSSPIALYVPRVRSAAATTSKRRLGRWSSATAVALVCGGSLAVASGTADAETRNPCADLAHRMAYSLDLARWYLASGSMLLDIGATDAGMDHIDIGQYFAASPLCRSQ